MKRITFTSLLLIAVMTLSAQEGRRLTILHTNDIHSHLQGYAPESAYTSGVADNDPTLGGLSRLAGIIRDVREENPGSTLVIDAGDCLMGTLFHSLEVETGFQIPLMKRAGWDVIAMGNHDFDFGPEAYAGILRKAAEKGELPLMLIGNAMTDPADPGDDDFEAALRDGLLLTYKVLDVNGIKVGLFSLLGKDADNSAPYAVPVKFENMIRAARKRVAELKREGCDVIICLSHSGISRDKHGNWSGEDVKLAGKVKGIDLIISGHTHTLLKEPLVVNGVPIVQTGSTGTHMGRADITFNGSGITLDRYEMIRVDDSIDPVLSVQDDIEAQKLLIDSRVLAPLDLRYDMPVAEAPFLLESDETGDQPGSNLGALLADAIYHYVNSDGPGTDIAMVAAGVIRDPIMPGVQSVADLFRVMSLGSGDDKVPGYPLSRLWVTGRELKNVAEILIFSSASTPSHFCYYSHLKIAYDPEGGLLNKIRRMEFTDHNGNVTEVNTSKEDKRLYSIVANSYMLEFVGIIKKKSLGLLNVMPKDEAGNYMTEMKLAIMDFDPATPGVQEGKEWIALVRYLQQMAPATDGSLPVISEYYLNPPRSLVQTGKR